MNPVGDRATRLWENLATLKCHRWVWLGLLAGLVAVVVLLYGRFVFLAGIDHDEVEHAHVGFRVLDGQVPYRDFYQNHWPAYWLVAKQFVRTFPFSVKAILAGRIVSLLALIGSWVLGFRLLHQVRGGRSLLARLVYTWAVILVAFLVEFHEARPDPIMALFGIAGLCLIPARGTIESRRSFLIGTLFGISASLSTKMAPMALVLPALVLVHYVRDRSLRPGITLVSYGLGVLLGLAPTGLWISSNDLVEAFYFDVWELNLALSKPWYDSFMFLHVPIYLAAVLGTIAWLSIYRRPSSRDRNGPLVLALALGAGLGMAFIARHAGLYNQQIFMIPLAIGFTSLVLVLWLRTRGLGYRLLLIAALLGYPTTHAGVPLVRLTSDTISQVELQELMDLARPAERTCLAFSPFHPVFCRDVSVLANHWDLLFAEQVSDARQLERFRGIWREAIRNTLERPPDLLLRSKVLERAVEAGLITSKELAALDLLKPGYDVVRIGSSEVWVRRRH